MINKCTPPQNQRGPRGAAVSSRLGVGALAEELSHCGAVPRFHFPLFLGASARSLGVLSLTSHTHVCVLSHFSDIWLCTNPGAVARQAPLSIGFSRQEYGRGYSSSGWSSHPGIKPVSPKAPALRHWKSPSYFMDSIKEKSWVPCQGKKKIRKCQKTLWHCVKNLLFLSSPKPCCGLPASLVHIASLHHYTGQRQTCSCIGMATWQRALHSMGHLKILSASLTWPTSKISKRIVSLLGWRCHPDVMRVRGNACV